jgi:hypothetical protein
VADSVQDQAARDDEQLRALGIKPELKRTLGFLSNFAIAFSFISVSTGSFGNFGVGIGLGGPASIFWSWLLIIGGQLLVALVFAELASHYPVAGSIYQWSKRLSNRTLGWFTGWFYFWAQVITVSAVAVIVGYVIAGFTGGGQDRSSIARPLGITTMFTSLLARDPIATTLINAFGVRLLSILNNIGVGTRSSGCSCSPCPAVLRKPPVAVGALDSAGTEAARAGTTCRRSPWACSWRCLRLRLRHRRDLRRGDRRCQPAGATRRPLVRGDLRDLGHRLPHRRDPGHPEHG